MSNCIKGLIAITLVMSLIISLVPTALAKSISDGGSSTVKVVGGTYKRLMETTDGNKIGARAWTYTTNDGIEGPAYCVNHGLSPASSTRRLAITGLFTSSPQTAGAFANGYPQRSLADFKEIYLPDNPILENLTEEEFAHATQFAVWATLGQLAIEGTPFDQNGRETIPAKSGEGQEARIYRAIQIILDSAQWWDGIAQPGMTVRLEMDELGGNLNIEMSNGIEEAANQGAYGIRRETINGVEYYTRSFVAASVTSTWKNDYFIEVWAEAAPEGTIFTDLNNKELERAENGGRYKVPSVIKVTNLNSNGSEYHGEFKLCMPVRATPESGAVGIYAYSQVAQYNLYLAQNDVATEQSYIIADPPYTEVVGGAAMKWNKVVSPYGRLIVNKVNDNGAPLAGAIFKLTGSDGSTYNGTSGANGEIVWENLNPDIMYTLEEVQAPEGYIKVEPQNVSVISGQTTTVTVQNNSTRKFLIKKIDAQSGASLKGATFRFEQVDGGYSTEATTSHDGAIEFIGNNLPFGTYKVYEVQAPAGYEKDSSVQTVTWDGTKDLTLTFKNVRQPSIVIIKTDADTNESLEGAVFNVYRDGSFITSVTTDNAGYARISGVSEGYYEVEEIQAPEGYVLDSARHGIYVDPYDPAIDDDPIIVIQNRRKPRLVIEKLDFDTQEPMKGTKFAVYRETTLIGEFTTDRDGLIELEDVEPGTYTVKEVATDSDHIVQGCPQSIEVVAGEYRLIFYNKTKPGMNIRKIDSETREPLEGAVFRIKQVDGSFEREYTTDRYGEIDLSKLEPGTYSVTEISAPDGYVIDHAERIFEAEPGGSVELVFTNTRKPELKLIKIDADTGEPLEGASFRIAMVGDGTRYLDRTTDRDGEIVIDDLLPGVYSVKEIAAPDGYLINPTEYHAETIPGKTSQIIISDRIKPSLRIIKYDSKTGETLPGTHFAVYRDTELIGEYTTDFNGEVNLTDLKPGTYTVQEIGTDYGHIVNSTPQQVEIRADSKDTAVLVFLNDQKPYIRLVKLDSETKEPLSGAVFSIKSVGDSFEQEYTTDTDGEIRLDELDPGAYTVTEISAPDGYVIDRSERVIQINGNEYGTFVFTDTRKPSLKVVKVDASTGERLPGAVIRISNASGTEVYEKTTDAKGEITLDDLKEDVYTVKEITAPDGYLLSDDEKQFTAIAGNTYEITLRDYMKPSLKIIKYDSKTGKALPDTLFSVFRDGELLGTYSTDEKGEILLYDLRPGTYTVEEKATDESHIVNSTPQTIKITEDSGDTAVLVFLNDQKPCVRIVKLDSQSLKPLPGAMFEIWSVGGNFKGTYTTDQNGEITIENMEEGTYSVTEIRAPEGYVMDSAGRTIKVSGNEYATFVFTDTRKPNLKVIKVDASTGKRLPGATFQIENVTNAVKKVTDENGEIVLEEIEEGVYSVKELAPPGGYLLNEEKYTLNVDAGNEYEVLVRNTKRPSLKIIKLSSLDGSPMAGTTFEVYRDAAMIGSYVTDKNGEIALSDLLPGTYTVKEVATDADHVVNSTPQTIEITGDAGDTAMLVFINEQKPYIRILKIDSETMKPLAGAVFEVKAADGSFVREYTTDADGEIRLDRLDEGVYTIRETKAPDGYVMDAAERIVEVKGDEYATFVFTNTVKPKLRITKIDAATGEKLGGAVFRIESLSGTEIIEKTTDSKGMISMDDLSEGVYSVREITPPEGYLLNTEEYHVELKAGETYELTVPNTRKPSLRIRKYDSLNGSAMPGATFEVYHDTVLVGKYTTDQNGEILLYDLAPGTYTVKEIAVDDAHIVNTTPQSIEITENSADTATLIFFNDQKPYLRILKIDSQTMQPLAGAVFGVSSVGGNFKQEYTTDASGEIRLDKLEADTYLIKETKAPEGYVMDSPGRVVEVNGNENATFVFTNTVKPSIRIIKVDAETGERLSGAAFHIENLNGSDSFDRTTDGNGEILIEKVGEGVYTVQEVTPPEGYQLNGEIYHVEAKAGAVSELVVPNTKKPNLRIIKYDSKNGKPIPNTTFEVYLDATHIGTYTTDKNGEINLYSLKPGTYTVKEVGTDADHVPSSTPQQIEIFADSGRTAVLVFLNDQKPYARLVKIDSESKKPLSGAVFQFKGVDNDLLREYTTDENGEIRIDGLDGGSYIVTEVQSPDGYVIDSAERVIEIKGNEHATFVFTNIVKPKLRITKIDAVTGEKLGGAVFRIENLNGTEILEKTTDDKGTISVEDLNEGVYSVREITPPEGYLLNTEEYHVEMKAGGTYELTVPNTRKPSLRIRKYDSLNGSAMPGATFEVYRDTTLVGSYTTDQNGEILLYDLSPGTYTVKEVAVDDAHIVNTTPQSIEITENSADTATLIFFNDQKPYLRILKIDSKTMQPLAGAVFEVSSVGGNFKQEYTTDASGEIRLDKLEEDTYLIKETKAPDGYVMDAPARVVEVKGNENATFVFTNTVKPSIRIIKVDSETGERLSGAVFHIENLNGSDSFDRTTDGNGEILIEKVGEGVYTVQETSPPEGYQLNGELYHVEAKAGAVSELIVQDTKRPSLRIKKYDSKTGEAMPGVTFEVYCDTVLIGEYKTDENGEILLYGLTPGTYTVKEISVDDGHIVNSTPQSIEITENSGDTATLIFLNEQKPYLRLVKLDSQTMQALPGAVFVIREIGGSYEKEYTTDENGEIRLDKLPAGAYTVTETKAPDGYLIDAAERTIEINGNEFATFVFTDTKKPTLKVIKKDAKTGECLSGASFRIAKIEDGSRYLDRTTDTNGNIFIDGLEPGVYSIKEIEAPDGYILNEREYHVELFPGKESQIVILNSEKPSLKIVKTDALTGKPIAGVGFLVRLADGSTENTVVIDENGEAWLAHLNEGVYEVIEKSVPAGYLIDTNSKLVTLETGRTSVVHFENYPMPSLVINKVDSITGNPLKGARFSVSYNSDKTDTGEKTDLGSYMTDENGRIHLYDLKTGWYKITETEAPAGYMLSEQDVQEIYIKAGENREFTFANTPKSALIIKKVDAVTGAVLQGAKFRLRYFEGVSGTGGTVIGEYMTSVNGTVVITGLAAGTYIVEETQAPSGYEITEPEKTVYISGEEQANIEVEFADKPSGQVIVQKLDSVSKQPLAGAEFLITTADGAYVANDGGTVSSNGYYVTDEYGQIVLTGVKPGTVLVITETKAPEGYVMETTSQTVEVSANDTQTITFFNKPSGQVIVQKLDSETKEPLAGAEFLITTADGAYVANDGGTVSSNGYYVTDEYGQIILTGVKPGTVLVITETKAPEGYELETNSQTVEVGSNDTQTITFFNKPMGGLIINKLDAHTGKPLRGAVFRITDSDGSVVGEENGKFTTDKEGVIALYGLPTGTYVVTETKAPSGYTLDPTPQTIEVKSGKIYELTFYNEPIGGLRITKIDDETRQPIKNVEFDVEYMDGKRIGTYRTDADGEINIDDLPNGWYTVIEKKAAKGYILDSEPHDVEVKDGKITRVTFTNRKNSSFLIHKVDSVTGKGIYGVTFLISDRNGTPVAQYTTDQNGYVYTDDRDFPDGKYYIREISVPQGYAIDPEIKTFYVEYGQTTGITWYNTPTLAQIQITKKSADDNQINGLPAGSLLEGAVFEIYDRGGNVVDIIQTDANGRASSKALALGVYTVRETKAPAYYSVNDTVMTANLEFAGQIVSFEVADKSVHTGVSIIKTGYNEVMPDNPVVYSFKDIGNTSNVPLDSFYWRDTVSSAIRCEKLVTGTYNQALSYKIVCRTNLSGEEYRTINDNLSTSRNYALDISPAALGLASGEYITEIMFVFGRVGAGFSQVEDPYMYAKTIPGLPNGSEVVNQSDVGGVYDGQWITSVSRWVTKIYSYTHIDMPRTGY